VNGEIGLLVSVHAGKGNLDVAFDRRFHESTRHLAGTQRGDTADLDGSDLGQELAPMQQEFQGSCKSLSDGLMTSLAEIEGLRNVAQRMRLALVARNYSGRVTGQVKHEA
jgi:hypothetical protein